MAINLEDLKPKTFKVKIRGNEIDCSPLRLSHALAVAKIGNVFQNPAEYNKEQIKQAEADMDDVIGELMPEIAGIKLDISNTIDVITQMMGQIEPSDNKELREKGVKLTADPKAERTG